VGFGSSWTLMRSFWGHLLCRDPDEAMGDYDAANDFSSDLGGGTLELNYLTNVALTQGEAAALQGTSFTLARVTFTGLANGLSR